SKVKEDDLVLLPGDISWGLRLSESVIDLKLTDELPGYKIISKGNHDYWWSSINKLNELELKKTKFLYNNAQTFGDYAIVGTRGWISKDMSEFKKPDEKIYNREVIRLENSIKAAEKGKKLIAMIHYPPYNQDFTANEFSDLLTASGVEICIYGHLHAEGHKQVFEGMKNDVLYKCVSSDYINFELQEIVDGKRN
ncbi:metallophosphoesterase, partial [Peptoniphilus asaccharolyticus]